MEAKSVARGSLDPDLEMGLVETPGRVSLRSSHIQVAPISALKMEFAELGMPSSKRATLIATFIFALLRNGIRRDPGAIHACKDRLSARTIHRWLFLKP